MALKKAITKVIVKKTWHYSELQIRKIYNYQILHE